MTELDDRNVLAATQLCRLLEQLDAALSQSAAYAPADLERQLARVRSALGRRPGEVQKLARKRTRIRPVIDASAAHATLF
ncbi:MULTISPECIES: hypothetical protein [Burkholderia]|uniref:hypothetical protein n=1 Tax=Burkholderia TaxID=32008 RepID=UPI000F5CEF4B|nr:MULTISPECIES: hypothetical protein [Burkholderia]MDD1493982.1 hypothetical protein [Burkholderia thailandensis]